MTDAPGRRSWSSVSTGVHGREHELDELERLLSSAPGCAVLLGSPGEGKTTLLTTVGDLVRREGWVVLSATGRVADRSLPFAALSELLLTTAPAPGPGQELRDRLLGHVRGANGPSSATPLGLRLDVLAWFEELAGEHRLLVTVDDAQWVDPSTLQILAFLAHRLALAPVALLFATRSERPPHELVDLPAVELRPLSAGPARRVLRGVRADLPRDAVQAVVERAAGNPLALLELARTVPSTFAEAPDEADLPLRLERAFAAELASLPEVTRTTLLLAAAGTEDLAVLARAAGSASVVDALEPAEELGLVRVHGSSVRFRHPLARQAVYGSATAAQRARAHHALAEAYPDEADRRAWHRAVSLTAPDEAVADELVAAARRAVDRVAYAEAARALRRAVELTPDAAVRERRVLELLQVGVPIGQLASQVGVARRLRDETTNPDVRAGAQQFIAYALTQTMDQEAARLALEDAVAQSAVLDGPTAWAPLTTLAVLLYQTTGDPAVLLGWVARLGRSDDEGPLVSAARTWVRAAAEPAARPPDLLEEVRGAGPLPPTTPAVVVGLHAMMLGAAAWLLDLPDLAAARLREARAILERANSQELVAILVALAQNSTDRVALDEAEEAARILFEIADARDLEYQRAVAQHTLAAVAALRGDGEGARRIADEVLTQLDLASCVALEIGLRIALADSWYGEDDLARWEQLRGAFDADGRPRHGRLSVRALVPAVTAASRCGRLDDARPLLEGVRDALPEPRGTYQAMVVTFAAAVLAEDAETDALFRAVVDDPRHGPWAFELADARLEYGRWLRRHRRLPEARNQLVPALRTFERLGTLPWVAAAKEELQRVGGSASSTDAAIWSSLTSQERQVVRLAATGLTNRAIGESLFLSPRTVGVHLYNAFPKLGVTSRAQLSRLVTRLDR